MIYKQKTCGLSPIGPTIGGRKDLSFFFFFFFLFWHIPIQDCHSTFWLSTFPSPQCPPRPLQPPAYLPSQRSSTSSFLSPLLASPGAPPSPAPFSPCTLPLLSSSVKTTPVSHTSACPLASQPLLSLYLWW